VTDFDVIVDLMSSAGASVLQIDSDDHGDYTVVTVAMVEETASRAVTTSPDMHGAAESSSVLAEGVLGLVVKCRGSTWSEVWANRDTLVAAARSVSWQISVTVDGVELTYQCRSVSQVQNPISPEAVANRVLDVTLSIPVHPIPVEGGS
jgi:hypothetical protein